MKKVRIWGIFIFLIISVLLHYIYEIIPIKFFSIIAPVNESIWEHMKLFFTSSLLVGLFDYILLRKNDIHYNNLAFSIWTTSVLSIPLYLIMYLPLKSLLGESMVLSIGLMVLTYIIMSVISYKILNSEHIKFVNKLFIAGTS